MTEKLNQLVRFWPIMAAIVAISVSWGTAEMRIAYANDGVEKNTRTLESVEDDVDELRDAISNINSSISRIDTTQSHIQGDVEDIKRMLERALNNQGE